MTLEDAKRELEHIRATAQDLEDEEKAISLERNLYITALENCIAHTINIPTLRLILTAQTIQFRKSIYDKGRVTGTNENQSKDVD
jgi:hypothetical protein